MCITNLYFPYVIKKAAAVSAAIGGFGCAAPREPESFVADRPFYYAILAHHKDEELTVLFHGIFNGQDAT